MLDSMKGTSSQRLNIPESEEPKVSCQEPKMIKGREKMGSSYCIVLKVRDTSMMPMESIILV